MEYKFNTGRLYQADGQWIKAIQLDDNSVVFADLSRGVDGVIRDKPAGLITSLGQMQAFVMRHYDRNNYEANMTSWKFHMQGR